MWTDKYLKLNNELKFLKSKLEFESQHQFKVQKSCQPGIGL